MITINNLCKNFGKKILFKGISLNVSRGEKIGLIGPNGSGKSTLFSLILGEAEPSSGTVQLDKGLHIGYLPQELNFFQKDMISHGFSEETAVGKTMVDKARPEAGNGHTVLSELTEGDEKIMHLKEAKERLEELNDTDSFQYGDILHQLETLGFFELEHKAKQMLCGLGFKERDFSRPISQMSGGWQMRALLAKLLTYNYDLLLLDEPTNYLDLNAALWLKDYLSGFRGSFIMISHDRAFLTDVTNYTLVLEGGAIFKVRGNYQHYEQIKEERRIHLEKQFKEQEKKRQQLERFVARFHAQPNKAAAVRAKRTALERLEREAVTLPDDPRKSIGRFSFPAVSRGGYRVMALKNISKAYGDIQVYKDFDFEITQGEKAVLAGENGAGKSTLLKIMAGVTSIDAGQRLLGHNVDIGYFSQTRLDVLNPENTVLREAYSASRGYLAEESIRTILGAFLFTGEDADKTVAVLSGGEKSRLILAKLLINPPNFLLLDEPTTHLDVDAVEALVKALTQYDGTLVFISHDIYFVRSIANTVFEVKNGRIRKFPGDFDYYLEKEDGNEVVVPASKPKTDVRKLEQEWLREKVKEEQRQCREEQRRRKSHNVAIREKINILEKEKEKLHLESYAKAHSLSNPRFYHDEERAKEYGRRLKEIEKRVAQIDSEIISLEKQILK
jgi:ATP-binding cassette subfamily F protein 3